MECIQEIAISYEPLKALGLPSWSSVALVVNDIRGGIGGQELGGTVDTGGWVGDGGMGEWKVDRRDR